MGKTECVLNVLGWAVTDRPAPIVYIGPSEKQVGSIARDRADELWQLEVIRAGLDARSSHTRTYERWVNGCRVGFAWAGSDIEVASHPAKICLVDEYDKMPAAVLENARSRTKTFSGGTLICISTPTVEGASNIAAQFEEGTRERWHLRCLHCDGWFYPRLALLAWAKDSRGEDLRASARLACPDCGAEHVDGDRDAMGGRYFPTLAEEGAPYDRRLDLAPRLSHRSFQVSGLCAFSQSWGQIAEIYARALRSLDQERIREVTNDQGGELYVVDGDAPPWRAVWDLRTDYHEPDGVALVTLGADVGDRQIHYVVRGWGVNSGSWLLEQGELFGDTAHDDVYIALGTIMERRYCGHTIALGLIDSGHNTAQVYAACRRLANLSPCKGQARLDKPCKDALVDERDTGRAVKTGVRLWHVDSWYWAQWVYGRVRWPKGEPGAWLVRADVTEDYCRQVVNEQLVELPTGRRVFRRTGSRQNHYGDCERYAAAAAHVMEVHRLTALAPRPPPPERPPETPAPPAPFARRGL